MKHHPLLPSLVFLLVTLSAAAQDSRAESAYARQEAMAIEVEALLSDVQSLELLSLDPRRESVAEARADNPDEWVQRWRVVGTARLADVGAIQELSEALLSGIRESNGSSAFCFSPRHALRFQSNGKQIVLIICFQCSGAQLHGIATPKGFALTGTPEPTFDRIFASLGLTKIE